MLAPDFDAQGSAFGVREVGPKQLMQSTQIVASKLFLFVSHFRSGFRSFQEVMGSIIQKWVVYKYFLRAS